MPQMGPINREIMMFSNRSGSSMVYDVRGQEAINGVIEATEKSIVQIPSMPTDTFAFVQQAIFEMMGMTHSVCFF